MADTSTISARHGLGTQADFTVERMLLQYEVEQFYAFEADLLDSRRLDDWLELVTDDVHYWMPIRSTRTSKDLDKEFTPKGAMAFFDDNKAMLGARVKRMKTGYAWAEDPPSRTRHMLSNIRVTGQDGDEVTAEMNFHVYRSRMRADEDNWIGMRKDRLRRVDGSLKLCVREIYLDHTTLLSPNLSNLF